MKNQAAFGVSDLSADGFMHDCHDLPAIQGKIMGLNKLQGLNDSMPSLAF